MSDALKYAKEVLEAHEKKPEASLPGLLLLARAVVRQDEEIAALEKAVKEQDSLLKHQAVELDDASQEISALREIYRWRKQSEEPAPKTYEKAIWIREEEYDCGGIFEWEGSVCCEKCVPSNCYWRPLDLPEEE